MNNTEDFFLNTKGSMCLVGSANEGGVFGQIINLYDNVIRFNNFSLENHENMMGDKTTHWVVNGWKTLRDKNFIPLCPFCDGRKETVFVRKFEQKYNKKIFLAKGNYALSKVERPSTGIMLIRLLISLGKKFDIYNFDGFKTEHYYGSLPEGRKKRFHNGIVESKEIVEYQKKGLLNIL